MKNMKKLASLLLALVMVLSLATTAFAAMEGDHTGGAITITNPIKNQTYSAYQILYIESYDAANNVYSYKANSAWADWLKTQTQYVSIDAQGYVTWVEDADIAAFAAAAAGQLTGKTADKSVKAADGNTSVVLSDLKLGYYLVDTTTGSLCSLTTTKPAANVTEKNEEPSVKKEVLEGTTWGESNDAAINQVVNFKATITVQKGTENYVLHDTMSTGLTFTGVTAVKVNNAAVDSGNYTVASTGLTDGCTFEVEFENTYIASLAKGTEIVIEYSAKLNENAVVGIGGNTNEVKLQYGDESSPAYTPEDTTTTYTWDVNIIKYTQNGGEEVKLAGATFKLTTDEAGENVLMFHALATTSEEGVVINANQYEHCADADCTKEHVTEITTDASGQFHIEGLDAGTYYLHETAAPAGYNKLADSVAVTITGATENADGDLTYTTVETKVENNAGSELPSTGGIGTTLFYVIGGVLMLAAVVLLVTKKRVSH